MKTLEELQSMSHDELVSYTSSLQDENQKACEKANYWYSSFINESSRFKSFRNSVKSVVELVELPKSSTDE